MVAIKNVLHYLKCIKNNSKLKNIKNKRRMIVMSGWNIDYFTSSRKEISQGDANEFMKNNVNALKQTATTSFDSVDGIYVTTVMYLLP